MLKYKTIIWPVIALFMMLSVNADGQRRNNLNRSIERFDTSGVAIDSGFITSDITGRALWVTRDSAIQILGLDFIPNFFNASLTQVPSTIKHISIAGSIEIEGPAAWMFDGSTSWEVDSWADDIGARINIDDGTGLVMQGMDTRLEMRANQIFMETDNTFFQISDFGSPGRMVFRANDYRFSDGVGGQYPRLGNLTDSLATFDAAGFLRHIPISTLPVSELGYSFTKVNTGGTWHDGKTIFKQSFNLGNGTGNFVATTLTVASVDEIIKCNSRGFISGGPIWNAQDASVLEGTTFMEVSTDGSETLIIVTIWFTE